MNKVFIFIAGFFMIAILSGCVSARKQQNPQPKAEVLCEEWDKDLTAAIQKNLSVRELAEQFIEACKIGDYSKIFAPSIGYTKKYSHIFIDAKIKDIVPTRNSGCFEVKVFSPQLSDDVYFYVTKYNIVKENKVLRTEWRAEIPENIFFVLDGLEKKKKSKASSM